MAAPEEARPDLAARLLLVFAAASYLWVFIRWSFRHFEGYGYSAYDLGIFDQGVWLLSRFEEPFVTIIGRHFFGDHTSFILLPFAAIYRLLPSPKVLLFAQTAALALGALPTFLIARRQLRDEMLAALLAVAYLAHPVLGWTNVSDGFHPDAFEIPLVLFTVWFVLRRRWVAYWICVVALLLVKEDVALLTFALGAYVAVRHHRRVGLATCALSAGYMALVFGVVIPGFLGAGTVYTSRIPFGGPTGLAGTALTAPGQVASHLSDSSRAWYLWQLFAPVAFVAWLAPRLLLLAAGPLALNLISDFPYQFDIRYHYSTLILPVIVVATIFGVARAAQRHHSWIVVLVFGAALVCAYLWAPVAPGRAAVVMGDPRSPAVASLHRAARLIPDDAAVAAFHRYVPQLSHRKEIYMFPNPWRASYWGTFDDEGERLPEADRVDFVLVPAILGPDEAAVLADIQDELRLVYDEAGVRLFERRGRR